MSTADRSTAQSRYLCVKEVPEDAGVDPLTRRCSEQCWQYKHIEEFEAMGEPPEEKDK